MDIHRWQAGLLKVSCGPARLLVALFLFFLLFAQEVNGFTSGLNPTSIFIVAGLLAMATVASRSSAVRQSLILTCLLSFAGGVVPPARACLVESASPSGLTPASANRDGSRVTESDLLNQLKTRLERSLVLSRSVLLGSRNPEGQSCVKVVTKGQVYNLGFDNFLDPNGGPGSTLRTIFQVDHENIRSPLADFAWFQGRLKTYLKNQSELNRCSSELVNDVAVQARQFYERVILWDAFPDELVSTGFRGGSDWSSYCMTSLDQAIARRDMAGTQRWAGELAAATFALADLQRWLGFLVDNHLTALAFQSRCQQLFELAEHTGDPYNPFSTSSNFPAGTLTGSGLNNYYEIERQAEQLFSVPKERLDALSKMQSSSSELIWILPEHRESYLQLRSALNEANQRTLDQAARSPFHRSFLANMLFRYTSANTINRLRNRLDRFNRVSPNASVDELLDALMYRAHSSSGLEWDDQFQPELTKAGNEIDPAKSNTQALLDAGGWTNRFYKPENYGATFTLRGAIMRKKLDCVRATDMIGTIFRNAGRSRYGNIRWCSEGGGHSVGAYLGIENNQLRTLIVDGMNMASEPEVWPDAYFNGHAWPAIFANNPTPYAVELYGRGIDSYIWLEGYIVRGPNAGQLTTAAIPYLEGRSEHTTQTVFNGPYPE